MELDFLDPRRILTNPTYPLLPQPRTQRLTHLGTHIDEAHPIHAREADAAPVARRRRRGLVAEQQRVLVARAVAHVRVQRKHPPHAVQRAQQACNEAPRLHGGEPHG